MSQTENKISTNSKALKLDTISNVVVFFWGFFSVLVITPFTFSKLGAVDYGIWVFMMSTLSYTSLLYLGFGAAIIRYIADYVTRKEYEKVNQLVSTLIVIYTGLGIITIIFTCILIMVLPNIIQISQEAVVPVRISLLIVGLSIGISFPLSGFEGILAGMQKYIVSNVINFIFSILYFVLLLLILPIHTSLVTLALITFLTTIIKLLSKYAYIKQKYPYIKIRLQCFDASSVRPLLKFSLKSFYIQISSQITNQLDVIIIGASLGPSLVAQYSIPQRMIQYVQELQHTYSSAFFPRFTQLNSKNEYAEIRKHYLNCCTLCFISGLFFIGLFMVYGDFIQQLWMGKTFQVSKFVIIFLGIYALLQQPALKILLVATNKHGPAAILLLCEAAVKILLSIIFIKFWGLPGVALSTLLPTIIISFIILQLLVFKYFGIPIYKYFSQVILKPLIAYTAPFLLLISCKQIDFVLDVFSFSVISALYSVVTFGSLLFFYSEFRLFVINSFKRMMSMKAGQSI